MKKLVFGMLAMSIFLCQHLAAQEVLRTIQLPRPDTIGGRPLMQVLKERKTSRSFTERKLPEQVISNLLWAAFGVNRPDGHRTAPSARNWQEIDIYAVTAEGVFLYDAKGHLLKQVLIDDLRGKTGTQQFVKDAPVNLVYVADLSRLSVTTAEDRKLYTGADCGFIAQNVYLYCASEGLSTVVRASVDRAELAKLMKLQPQQEIVLAQTVGYGK